MIWPSHGANPQHLYAALGLSVPENYLDFSANINPLGPPPALEKEWPNWFKLIQQYPDPKALSLLEKLASKEDVERECLLIGNGGAEIITLVARMLAGKNVLIVQPAFSEYEEACKSNGCKIDYWILEGPNWELDVPNLIPKLSQYDAIFLCRPNNPTGVVYDENKVLQLLHACKEASCYCIVDEAFYDFVSDTCSFVRFLKDYPNLIILRSLTKMFAIPGLRLGYVIGHREMIEQLNRFKPHWSTNALAIAAGELCLQFDGYIVETRKLIQQEREKLFSYFTSLNFSVSPSSVNFYLLRDPSIHDQAELFMFLIKNGVIPRHTMNFPGLEGQWLRFAIKGPADNSMLMEVLAKWRNQSSL